LYGKAEGAQARYKYCSAACAAAVRKSQNKPHHDAYYKTKEGHAQHADEEQRRRDRRKRGVGAQSFKSVSSERKMEPMELQESRCAPPEEEPVEWLVEVWPEDLRRARRLCAQRKEMTCMVCGVRGYVAKVVVVRPKAPKRRPGGLRGPLRRRE